MPVKELIALSAVVMAAVIATHPTRPREAIRDLQMRILRDVSRTDNWGNPSLYRHHPSQTSRKISRPQ